MEMKHGQLFFLAFELPVAAVTSTILLVKFCGRHRAVPLVVAFIVGLVWFMCLLIPVLLPLDLADTMANRCHALHKPDYKGCTDSQSKPQFIMFLWHACYWACFTMSWLVLPLVASYLVAGAFSAKKKLLFALRDRLIFFAICGVSTGVVILLLIIRFEFSLLALSGVFISLANMFGVFVAILMLSYGLIEVPKWLWRFGNYEEKLRLCEYRATHTMERVDEARASMAAGLGRINSVVLLYENSKKEMPLSERKTIKKYIKLIKAEVPTSNATLSLPRAIVDETAHSALTEEFLAGLRFSVKKKVIEFRKVNYLWRKRCVEAFELQDVLQWKRGELEVHGFLPRLFFGFRAYILPVISRFAALGAVILTTAFIWSESTLWSIMLPKPLDLSPFSILLHHTFPPYVLIQVVCFLCVSYLFFCLFFGIFRFRLFMLYELVPKHTDAFTLVLNAMLCSRLLIPLAFNFTTVMHETHFSASIIYQNAEDLPILQIANLHRGMDEVPFFGVGFNLYFPSVIVVFALLALFRVWDRLMNMFDMNSYSFEGVGDERLEAFGRNLIAQERSKWLNARRKEQVPHPRSYVGVDMQVEDASAQNQKKISRKGREKGTQSRPDPTERSEADGNEVHRDFDDGRENDVRISVNDGGDLGEWHSEIEAFGRNVVDRKIDLKKESKREKKHKEKKIRKQNSGAGEADDDDTSFEF